MPGKTHTAIGSSNSKYISKASRALEWLQVLHPHHAGTVLKRLLHTWQTGHRTDRRPTPYCRHVQPKACGLYVARHSSYCSPPHCCHTIVVVALPHRVTQPGSRCTPRLFSDNQTLLFDQHYLGHGKGAVQSWLKLRQIILCILTPWLHTVLWTAKTGSSAFCIDKGIWQRVSRLKKKKTINFLIYLQLHLQST